MCQVGEDGHIDFAGFTRVVTQAGRGPEVSAALQVFTLMVASVLMTAILFTVGLHTRASTGSGNPNGVSVALEPTV